VLSEANRAREDQKLVQVTTDASRLPMPFDTIQCAKLAGWSAEAEAGWCKLVSSIAQLVGSAFQASPAPSSAPCPTKPSIAVLPFANLSGDPDQDYFANGMVVEIATALSSIPATFVIAGGSGLSFKGKGVSPQEAARQLGVRYVLDGSVRKAANRVQISVNLVDGADGSQTWAERFEDTLDDVFALQDKVALNGAGVIEPKMAEGSASADAPP
jgi:adenylate cyclase